MVWFCIRHKLVINELLHSYQWLFTVVNALVMCRFLILTSRERQCTSSVRSRAAFEWNDVMGFIVVIL